jgi:hypothetical protein
MKKHYVGWIYISREVGMNDYFHVQWRDDHDESKTRGMGYAAGGASASIDFFEKDLGYGHVLLEETPIGLRVYVDPKIAVDPEVKS